VELLRDGLDEVKANTVGTLMNLTYRNDANQVAVVAAGALPPLVDRLWIGSHRSKAFAVRALGNLTLTSNEVTGSEAIKVAVLAACGVPPLVELLQNGRSAEGRRK